MLKSGKFVGICQAPRSWQSQDTHGLPVAVCVTSASQYEVKLVEQTIDATFLDEAPDVLIGDKAYDSDQLDQKLRSATLPLLCIVSLKTNW